MTGWLLSAWRLVRAFGAALEYAPEDMLPRRVTRLETQVAALSAAVRQEGQYDA